MSIQKPSDLHEKWEKLAQEKRALDVSIRELKAAGRGESEEAAAIRKKIRATDMLIREAKSAITRFQNKERDGLSLLAACFIARELSADECMAMGYAQLSQVVGRCINAADRIYNMKTKIQGVE